MALKTKVNKLTAKLKALNDKKSLKKPEAKAPKIVDRKIKTFGDVFELNYILLKLPSKEVVAKRYASYEAYANISFQSDIILFMRAEKHSEHVMHIFYMVNAVEYDTYIGKDVPVSELVGEELSKFQAEQFNLMSKNIHPWLSHSFTIGSDPEIFIEDKAGVVVPAFNFLGSKQKPSLTAPGTYGGKPLYWDGFQAEFETTPIRCLAWHVDSVQAGLKGALIEAKKHNPDAKLSSRTVMDIPQAMLNEAAPEHVAFGCMPSLNAYGIKGLSLDGREVNFRPAGGHIHFGVGKCNEDEYVKMVKALDAILGVACVSLFASFDNPKRRELYGLPGEYRLPPHGLEYRTLSNAWLFHPLIMNLVFDLARKSLTFGRLNLLSLWQATEEETVNVILTSDVKKAQEILTRNKAVFFELLYASYGKDEKKAELLFNIFMNGMESAIEDPTNINGNWNLEGNWHSHGDGIGKNVRLAEPMLVKGKKVS